jgi:hypothetical protein
LSAAPLEAAELVVEGLRRREPAHRPLFLRALMAHAAAGLALIEGPTDAGEAVYRIADAVVFPRRSP